MAWINSEKPNNKTKQPNRFIIVNGCQYLFNTGNLKHSVKQSIGNVKQSIGNNKRGKGE